MPAPKQYKPGPRITSERERNHASQSVTTKGKYVVSAPSQPLVDEEVAVEVEVDDVTVVMPVTKYDRRSMHAYGDVGASEDEEEDEDEFEESPAESTESLQLGEWRTEVTLEGSHYHRKDTRLG
ncbi:MAG: hypothetical protein ABFS21_09580 [Actinomycetota bacterium]